MEPDVLDARRVRRSYRKSFTADSPAESFVACKLQTQSRAVHSFRRVPRDDTTAPVVGQTLCEAREAAGLTQEELAARAAMDRSSISDIERGTASLSVDRLLRLCRALGTPAAEVVGRIEERLADEGGPGTSGR